jgi:glycosyltransferase involved in cell wall biosynthesis
MPGEKVLYILPQPYLLSRGSSFRAQATLDALADLGYQVDLLCYPVGIDPKNKKYTVLRSRRPPFLHSVKIGPSVKKVFFDIPLALSARQLEHKKHYDIIHGVEEAGFIAVSIGSKMAIPSIFDMHSWMSQQIEDGHYVKSALLLNGFKKFEARAMNRARAIITVGDEMTEILHKSLAPKVYSVTLPDCPLAIEESLIPPELREDISGRFFSRPAKTILYTGNFHSYQGIDLLLAAFRELKSSVSGRFDLRLLLVGGGVAEKKSVNLYRKMAADFGIDGEVEFCGEFPVEAMPVFMEKADILVSSRVKGNNVPLKVYTYLASGKLLVATRIPSHTQVLNDNNCLLADPEPAALSSTLLYGLEGIPEEDRRRITIEGRRIGGEEQRRIFQSILQDCYRYCLERH